MVKANCDKYLFKCHKKKKARTGLLRRYVVQRLRGIGKNNKPEFSVKNITKAMEQLPEGGKMIFSLYLLEGYDHGEIAQIMGITESTSKSQFMRAKRRIVEILKTQNIWS